MCFAFINSSTIFSVCEDMLLIVNGYLILVFGLNFKGSFTPILTLAKYIKIPQRFIKLTKIP